jgi:hypothetical protein
LNNAVLKQQSDAATVAALEAQDLTGCPSAFVQAFVGLRTAVRSYMQTQQEIRTHSLGEDDAVGQDMLLNLPCSLMAGQQCFNSSINEWQRADAALKQRDAENAGSLAASHGGHRASQRWIRHLHSKARKRPPPNQTAAARWTTTHYECSPFAALLAVMAVPALAGALQVERDTILRDLSRERVASLRATCATGTAAESTARQRNAGLQTLSTGAFCVTLLTRAGRDGTLGYVRDTQTSQPSAANAFDSGFVSGYFTRETMPAGTPAMATLLPLADRCLENAEPNTTKCSSAGYVLGARAARGELVPVS